MEIKCRLTWNSGERPVYGVGEISELNYRIYMDCPKPQIYGYTQFFMLLIFEDDGGDDKVYFLKKIRLDVFRAFFIFCRTRYNTVYLFYFFL